MDTVIWSWWVSELAWKLPSRVRLGHLPNAILQLSWLGWRQWSLTPSSGMSGSQEFQHQLGTSGCSKPGVCILRQWKMSIGAGWRRSWQHLSVGVGECGLNETAGDMELQEKVFKWQILLAHQLKKPLVLHLRGKTPRTTSALYGRALALTTSILHKRHKVYLHSFSAGQAEFQLWHRSFPELLVGRSWLTTSELSCETMLRSMPATVIALETDSPHLASRIGIVNSPYQIYEQAVTTGEIRNLPTSTVIECSNRALHRFYALWVGAQWLVFNVSARMTSEWNEHGNLHILLISGTLTQTSQ